MNRFFRKYTHRLASSRMQLEGNDLMLVGEVSHFDPSLALTWMAFYICSYEVEEIN